MEVIKRDGTKVPFDKQKIINAISKANKQVDFDQLTEERIKEIATEIEEFYKDMWMTPQVEEIQDMVEEILMAIKAYDVAKEYVRYRFKRQVARDSYNVFMNAIAEKLEARNPVKQNANVDEESFGGRAGEASNVMTKQYALDNLISPMAKTNHLNNRIYIHDLDAYALGSHNCLTIPFDKLLAKGFNTRQTDVRPAQSINTAFQLIAVIFQLQSLNQFGGCSASHIDWTMVPYVRKSFAKHYKDGLKYIGNIKEEEIDYEIKFMLDDIVDWSIEDLEWKAYNKAAYKFALDKTEQEARQAAEGMYHNLK